MRLIWEADVSAQMLQIEIDVHCHPRCDVDVGIGSIPKHECQYTPLVYS